MLEAQQIVEQKATPSTPAQLDKAWDGLLDVVNMLAAVPKDEPRRKALYQAYDAWDLLRWNTERQDWSKPYEPDQGQFQKHLAMFLAQQGVAGQLAKQYAQKAITGQVSQGGTLPELKITARPPAPAPAPAPLPSMAPVARPPELLLPLAPRLAPAPEPSSNFGLWLGIAVAAGLVAWMWHKQRGIS
jgi:hypothetical protein